MSLLIPVCAAELRVSDLDQRRFGDQPGTLLFVRPGNDGSIVFTGNPNRYPGNLQPWQDEYCNAHVMQMDKSDYDLRLGQSHVTNADYWRRMDSYVTDCTYSGAYSLWLINDSMVGIFRGNPGLVDDVTSRIRQYDANDMIAPTLLFETSSWSPDHQKLLSMLRQGLEGLPVGIHFTQFSPNDLPRRGFDFAVVDEEMIPETYRGQAAPLWAHREFGQVPAVISPAQPDFLRDTVWLSCGAAGIYYRPLAPIESAANSVGAINLRASSAFMGRFGQAMHLVPRPPHPDIMFALEGDKDAAAWVIQERTASMSISLPLGLDEHTVSGTWFNPATDDNIIEPITTASTQITLTPPSDALWVFSLVRTDQAADTATTVSAIRSWED